MKRIVHILFTIAVLFGSLYASKVSVYATDYQSTTCNVSSTPFTVDQLSVSGSTIVYTSQGCYTNYYDANSAFDGLKNGGSQNIVIRYFGSGDAKFQSPLKIIKADRAMAYTQNYTYTVGDISQKIVNGVTYDVAYTIRIFNDVALTNAYTYLDNKEPLYYYTTEVRNTQNNAIPSNMAAYVEINGAKGYITLDGIDIIPYIYLDNANFLVPFYNKVSDSTPKQLYIRDGRAPGIIPAQTQYTVIGDELKIGVDRATSFNNIGIFTKAASWMTNGSIYYSPDGIRFFSDYTLSDYKGSNYNYFNYLSLRSKSTITADQLNSFLIANLDASFKDGVGDESVMINQAAAFTNSQETYGMNALLIYSMALLESGKGTSDISLAKLNIFSVNATDANTGGAYTFTSIEDAVTRQMGIYLRYYMDTNSSNFYASNIGNKGAGLNTKYASDPFWSTKIAQYAYLIDKSNGLQEWNKYSLALLKPTISSTFYKDRNLTTSLYSIPSRAINYPVTLTASYNNAYYLQSTSPIVSGSLVTNATSGFVGYDWNNSVAYINQNQVDLVNTPTQTLRVVTDTDTLLTSVKDIHWNTDNTMYIKGYSAFMNTNMANVAVTHSITAVNLEDPSKTYTFNLNVSTGDVLKFLYNFDYSNAWFEGSIDISTLPDGFYKFILKSSAGDTTGESNFSNSLTTAPRLDIKTINSRTYNLSFNNKAKMRYELAVETGLGVENRSTSIPSQIPSVGMLTNLTFDNQTNLFNIAGFSFINETQMTENDLVSHKLLLVTNSGSRSYDLTTSVGQNLSINPNFKLNNVWFNGSIDFTDLANGTYRIYVLTNTGTVNDLVKIYDSNYTGVRQFESTTKYYSFKVNSYLRNTYYLEISDKVQ